MNFIVENWYLILLAVVSGAMLLLPALQGGAGGLSTAAAVQLINREKGVLIDVCGADEYAAIHAVGAKNVPLADLESRLPAVAKNKALPLVLVCARGSRAQRAAAVAQKLGYTNAQVLAGGLKAWQDAGLPVEKKA
ncbi:rhodanese-like domain-containing protein [Giesbergeria anulus]|uniref:Rhodanese-related sulfurtransferase n=1 Tax=Giesbergeria anulus TaxID=180197 RepID=A0A1H9ITG8_9BURK|nr:rhodanese-like domain-containing protein [Giesbergeria anulus]SEQ77890.1 Rhodanese-related sulfurtransferase [Giesbergeria anulus]